MSACVICGEETADLRGVYCDACRASCYGQLVHHARNFDLLRLVRTQHVEQWAITQPSLVAKETRSPVAGSLWVVFNEAEASLTLTFYLNPGPAWDHLLDFEAPNGEGHKVPLLYVFLEYVQNFFSCSFAEKHFQVEVHCLTGEPPLFYGACYDD